MHHKECTYLQYVVAMHVGTLNSTFNLTGFYTDLNRRSACLHTYVHSYTYPYLNLDDHEIASPKAQFVPCYNLV